MFLSFREFETLLRDDSVEDPMDVWYNYVVWLEQSFPSHTHKANIGTVLKKCISKFKQSEEYKNDERFVRLCLKFVSKSTAPGNFKLCKVLLFYSIPFYSIL